MKIELDLPDEYGPFIDYLDLYFIMNKKQYFEKVLREEIESRNRDLKLF